MINLNATLIIQLINFLLLMVVLDRILFRPMVRVIEERRARTEGRQEKAAEIDSDAERILADYRERIQEAKTEADRIRKGLVREAEDQRQKTLDSAAAEAESTVAEIRARVRAEVDDARQALRADTQRLAADMAERILGRHV